MGPARPGRPLFSPGGDGMSAVHRLLPAVLAVSALAVTLPAQTRTQQAGGQETWITIERGVAERASSAFVRSGRDALAIEGDGNIVVTQVRESDMGFLSRTLHKQLRRCGGFIAYDSCEAALHEAARANAPEPERTSAPQVDYTIDNAPVVQAL